MLPYFTIVMLAACLYAAAAWILHRRAVRDRGPRERLRAGMEVHLSAYGQTLLYGSTRDQTGGARFTAAWAIDARSSGPAACLHPRAAVRIKVHGGRLTMIVRGRKAQLAAGDGIEIPRRTAYRYFNAEDDPVSATLEVVPASAMDMFVLQLDRSGLGHDERPGLRACLQWLCLATTYDCTYLAALPIGVQKALAVLLWPVARLLGIRTYYAE